MVQSDYILRMIEAIGLIALQIKRMLRAGSVAEAKTALREAQAQVGVDLDMARVLSGDSLLSVISSQSFNFDLRPRANADVTDVKLEWYGGN